MRTAFLILIAWCEVATGAINQPQFFARRDYSSNGTSGFVAVADINGDGIPDLVATYVDGSNVYTLLGNGNGTFRSGATYQPGFFALSNVVPIDLNGDGKIDLVIAGSPTLGSSGGIGVCFGNGNGTFQPPVTYAVADDFGFVMIGDFNGDGIPDAALASELGVWIFIGKGGGVFDPGVLSISVSNTTGMVSADFNGDGKLDLAFGISGAFEVAFGNGNGTFQTPVSYAVSGTPTWLAAGDLTGDGSVDLVVGNEVYLNNGKGTFAPVSANPVGPQFAIGDVNGDHIPDLVGSLGQVALGRGNGQFAPPKTYPVESAGVPHSVVVADLRKNGRLDIVTGDAFALSVLLNEGKGEFEDGITTPLPNSGNCGASADFNGDGIPDLAVPTTTGTVILLGTGKANPPYTTGATIPLSSPGCPITGDLNNDGIADLLQPAGSLGGVGVYLGNGDGTFTLASVIPFGGANILVLGDFNHDGIPDVATSSNQFALGNGDGTFQPPQPILPNPPLYGFTWIAAGDVNNDGWTDLVATQSGVCCDMYVLLNNQQGGFNLSKVHIGLYTTTFWVMLSDLNGDGNLDAVVGGDGDVFIFLGNGLGQFKLLSETIPYPGPDPLPPQVGDVNGDGIPDILLPADGSIRIALGKGNGTFVTPFAVGAGGGEGQILLANQHGQSPTAGLPDLISPDGSQVWVLLNLTK